MNAQKYLVLAANKNGEVKADYSNQANDGESTLYEYATGEVIRKATPNELRESREAANHDGGAGVIRVDGKSCYVSE